MLCWLGLCLGLQAATGRVLKVLPHFLDAQGLHTRQPGLFDRDTYQHYLRYHPEKRGGLRYDVYWTARAGRETPLRLRLELRGVAEGRQPRQLTRELTVRPGTFWPRKWTAFVLQGEEYQQFGEVTAWRVSLWEGDRLLSEKRSFLW